MQNLKSKIIIKSGFSSLSKQVLQNESTTVRLINAEVVFEPDLLKLSSNPYNV